MIGRTFSVYLGSHYLKNFIFVLLLFIGLIVAVDMIELSRQMSRIEGVTFGSILAISLYRAPAFAENILPFATLFGAAMCLLLLNKRLELVVARASGVSVWQFLLPLALAAAIIGVIAALAYNPLSLIGQNLSRSVEAGAFGKVRGSFSNRSSNFWLRLGQANGDVVIRARVSQNAGVELTAVSAYRFDAEGISIERLDAASASFVTGPLGQNYYLLKDVVVTIPGERSDRKDEVVLPVNTSVSQLQATSTSAEDVGFWNLLQQAERARIAGRNPLPFQTQFHALLSRPFLFVAMVLLAATFSLRFARFGQSGRVVMVGIGSGFMLYVVSRLVLTFGSNGLVSPLLAAWSPAFVASLIAITVLLHQEDG